MSASTKPGRRTVRYASLNELLSDAERMAAAPHETVGNWSYGQILWHLARGMNCTFDGFGFQAPWWARKLIAPLMKKKFLRDTMSAGFKLPDRAKGILPDGPVSVEEGLAALRSAIARYETETPTQPHPFLGQLSRDETIQLQMRHSELHMSFVVPKSGAEN